MEITEYIPFIKEQFQEIENLYGMSWSYNKSEYLISLENDNTLIDLFSERREKSLGIIITNKQTNNYYTISEIIDLKTKNNNHLTELDKQNCKAFNDQIKVIVYVSALIFQNHCQDMLSGDFSSVGPGNLN